jgi:hypothetical protein
MYRMSLHRVVSRWDRMVLVEEGKFVAIELGFRLMVVLLFERLRIVLRKGNLG